jgi:hypothetical protein
MWRFGSNKYNLLASVITVVSLVLFMVPIIGAYKVAGKAQAMFTKSADSSLHIGKSSPY